MLHHTWTVGVEVAIDADVDIVVVSEAGEDVPDVHHVKWNIDASNS